MATKCTKSILKHYKQYSSCMADPENSVKWGPFFKSSTYFTDRGPYAPTREAIGPRDPIASQEGSLPVFLRIFVIFQGVSQASCPLLWICPSVVSFGLRFNEIYIKQLQRMQKSVELTSYMCQLVIFYNLVHNASAFFNSLPTIYLCCLMIT